MYRRSYDKPFAELKLFDPDIDAKLAALDDEYEHCKHLRVGVAFNKDDGTGTFILPNISDYGLLSQAWVYLYCGALIFAESSHGKINRFTAEIIPDNKDDLDLDMLKMFYNLKEASSYLFGTVNIRPLESNQTIGEITYKVFW